MSKIWNFNGILQENGNKVMTSADWNQNDETASNYMHNRPFYTADNGDIVQIEEKYIPDTIARTDKLKLPKFVLVDEVTGLEYIVKINNGNLIYMCPCTSVSIEQGPIKTVYAQGSEFDPTGIILMGTYENGYTNELVGFTCTADTSTAGFINAVISYDDGKTVHTVTTEIEVIYLGDFTYTTNDDGTYTITGWKGTYNGEPSTEMIFPDHPAVIL